METNPKKKERLLTANNVLKLASKLLKVSLIICSFTLFILLVHTWIFLYSPYYRFKPLSNTPSYPRSI